MITNAKGINSVIKTDRHGHLRCTRLPLKGCATCHDLEKLKKAYKFIDNMSGYDCELADKWLNMFPCAYEPHCNPCAARAMRRVLEKDIS